MQLLVHFVKINSYEEHVTAYSSQHHAWILYEDTPKYQISNVMGGRGLLEPPPPTP